MDLFYNSNNSLNSTHVENNIVYQSDVLGNKKLLGYTANYVAELEDTLEKALSKAEEYHSLLVSNGIIEKEKTQDDINKELLNIITDLKSEILNLKGEVNDRKNIQFHTNESTNESNGTTSISEKQELQSEQHTRSD